MVVEPTPWHNIVDDDLFVRAGFVETTMAEILGTNSQTSTIPLTDPKTGRSGAGMGTISVRMDEVEHQHDLVTIKLRAKQVSPDRPGVVVVVVWWRGGGVTRTVIAEAIVADP